MPFETIWRISRQDDFSSTPRAGGLSQPNSGTSKGSRIFFCRSFPFWGWGLIDLPLRVSYWKAKA